MKRFVTGEDRSQSTLFPERLDEYIAEDNPVRVIDAFVDELDLGDLGFERVQPQATGRPAYHPSTLLKIYIYGYLNRVQSSRRLERETQRNVELMWLTGQLTPDFKTIADFRKENGKAIQRVCREFVELCRHLELFTQAMVAIDGSKFKAVNNKDNNDTRASMKRRISKVEEHIERYMSMLDEIDSEEPVGHDMKEPELKEKIAALKTKMSTLKEREAQLLAHPDKQLSDTDPDSRLMNKGGGSGSLVAYNVQSAVDTQHKLIVAHEVTNAPVDRNQLVPTAKLVQEALKQEKITVLADRGYYKSKAIEACYEAGIRALVPKTHTSGNKAKGLFDKYDFHYDREGDLYVCPAGAELTRRLTYWHLGIWQTSYQASVKTCRECRLKPRCYQGRIHRQVRRSQYEDLLERMAENLKQMPNAMGIRAATVEHPFGTIKHWMGNSHFLMKRLENVRTEMSLHVLAYNMKRMMSIKGVIPLMKAIRA